MPRVIPEWFDNIPLQQQSVMLLATRGPDGVRKHHPCKAIVRCYRGTVLCAAKYGRFLRLGESADDFMSMKEIAAGYDWVEAMRCYFGSVDELPHHYHLHLLHGAQVLSLRHPDERVRLAWGQFYSKGVDDMHLNVEEPCDMDLRLSDWRRRYWEEQSK